MIWTDCKMFYMPQRSEPWHDMRKGKLTASQAGDWLAEEAVCRLAMAELREAAAVYGVEVEKKLKRDELLAYLTPQLPAEALPLTTTEKSSGAKQTAINKCLGALAKLSGPPDYDIDPDGPPPRNPALWAIWNGIRLEDEAREALQRRIGEDIEEVGFCLHPKGAAGCSPDGLVKGRRIGVEIKCPISETHVGYLRNGKLPSTYKAQVHFSMAITGAEAWHFWSYCPGLPPFHLLVERDRFTESMVRGIDNFSDDLADARAEMEDMWNQEFGKDKS